MLQLRIGGIRKVLAVSMAFASLVSCNGKPIFWDYFNKGESDDYWDSPFLVAAVNGDVRNIERFLKKGIPPDGPRSDHGCTALHKAVEYHQYEVIKILMEARADPGIVGFDTTSIEEALGGSEDIRSFRLLENRSNLLEIRKGHSLLSTACEHQPSSSEVEDAQIVETLLKVGCDPNFKGPEGNTPLTSAAKWGKEKTIDLLLHAGAQPQLVDGNGNTARAIIEKSRSAAILVLNSEREDLRKFQAGDKTILGPGYLPGFIEQGIQTISKYDRIIILLDSAEGRKEVPAP